MEICEARDLNELATAERLSALVYLDSLSVGPLREVLMGISEEKWPCRMSKQEWDRVIEGAKQDNLPLSILTTEEDVSGHRAVLFGDRDRHGYVVFRGTGSDEEWEDNAKGMLDADTPQQKKAADFVLKAHRHFRHITVAGHSKGGNKAQYAAITLDCVDRCFSFDGQGFSVAFCEKYKEAIERRKPVLNLISERRGFVHALGINVAKTRYLAGWRGDPRPGHPHGDPLPYFHCPDALRSSDGALGKESSNNPIPEVVNRLVCYFLQNPKYSKHWEVTAKGLTALMIHEKKQKKEPVSETAVAIAHMLGAARSLAARDMSYRRLVAMMAIRERNVLLASLGAAEWELLRGVIKAAH